MKDIKTYYVYELRNSEHQVEYVGYTTKPTGRRNRFYQHTRVRPNHSGNGKFYGRTDLTFNVVYVTQDKEEAKKLEGKVKLSHGLEWSERTDQRNINNRNRKLTQAQAQEIRSKYIPRTYTMMRLADEYGVSYKTVQCIIKNEIYKI